MTERLRRRVRQGRFRDAVEAAFVALLVTGEQLQRRLEELCATQGITHAQYNVLRILRGAGSGGHPRFEIASRLIGRAPDVTRLLDRLVRLGLIERASAPDNRRLSIARITAKGSAVLDRLEPGLIALQEATFAGVPRPAVEALTATLDQLVR